MNPLTESPSLQVTTTICIVESTHHHLLSQSDFLYHFKPVLYGRFLVYEAVLLLRDRKPAKTSYPAEPESNEHLTFPVIRV